VYFYVILSELHCVYVTPPHSARIEVAGFFLKKKVHRIFYTV